MTTPTIIFENNSVLAINKPAGLVVHPAKAPLASGARPAHQNDVLRDGKTEAKTSEAGSPDVSSSEETFREETLCDWLTSYIPEIAGVGEPLTLPNGVTIDRPGIVHRLDRETSGVMIIAKTQEAFMHVKAQFQDRKTEKAYRAIACGVFKEKEGRIDEPIGKSKRDPRKWLAGEHARGTLREAQTDYKVLAEAKPYSYLELTPKTGRTHQIRVHLKAVGHPVVCDPLYGTDKGECSLGISRLALHAHALTLTLPTGEYATFEAPLPDDFKSALAEAGLAE